MNSRVLVVDDNLDTLEPLCDLLGISGYDVDAATDAKAALGLALRNRPDLVVMDLSLPGGDAIELIARLKVADEHVVIIAFSGWHQLEGAARAAGANAFIVKPNLDGLLEALERPLAASATRRVR